MKTKTSLAITAAALAAIVLALPSSVTAREKAATIASPEGSPSAGSASVEPTVRPTIPPTKGFQNWRAGGHASHSGGKVSVRSNGDRVVIQLGLARPEAWSLNLATGQLSPTGPVPQDNVNPNTGIGVVIKKNPGSSAARTMPTSGGGATLPTDLEPGGYDIVVRIPPQPTPNARTRPGSGRETRVKFHVNVSAEGITRDRGITPTVSQHAVNSKGTGAN